MRITEEGITFARDAGARGKVARSGPPCWARMFRPSRSPSRESRPRGCEFRRPDRDRALRRSPQRVEILRSGPVASVLEGKAFLSRRPRVESPS
jgi:hypothetical protein